MMPVLTGIGLAIQMREFCPSCKVILFSGHPATVELIENARANGHDFEAWAKPVHPTAFLEKILLVMDAPTA
jgi:FixJ family two-component response regulator